MRTEPVCGIQLVKTAQMSEKYDIKRDYYKSNWKIQRSQFMREQALEQLRSLSRLLQESGVFFIEVLFAFAINHLKVLE